MNLNEKMKTTFQKDEIKKVFDDEIKFKMKLKLTEDTYKYLLDAKNLEKFASVLAAGIAAAAGGYLAWLGGLGIGAKILLALGFIANPIGWYALAGVGGAALMYGGKKLIENFDKEAYDKIPKFLNTPMDYLGQNLINIILPIAIKISMINGQLTKEDEKVIVEEFKAWGYNENYIRNEIEGIKKYIDSLEITDAKKKLEAICKNVDGLEYNTLKSSIQKSLQSIFTQKVDQSNSMELKTQTNNLN